MPYEYDHEEFGRDIYRYTCECGWSTLVPEGADVACCPNCEARSAEALAMDDSEKMPTPEEEKATQDAIFGPDEDTGDKEQDRPKCHYCHCDLRTDEKGNAIPHDHTDDSPHLDPAMRPRWDY